jgi:hypothetical protein
MMMTAPAPHNALLEAARRWYDSGYCVVPSHQDRSKRPHSLWAQYQEARPAWTQIETWLSSGDYDGIGVISGAVSGGVEMIEIEGHAIAAGAADKLLAAAQDNDCADLLRRVFTGCSERSAGGGLHLFVRVTDSDPLPNTRLAYTQSNKIIAETRGEGGFVIVAPTPARTGHEPGSKYEFLTRGPEQTAEVTGEERDIIHLLMSIALDERTVVEPEPQPQRVAQRLPDLNDPTPGDRYASTHSWQDILEPHGWVKVSNTARDGAPGATWRRPGKTEGISATTGGPGDHLYVFSSSTGLPSEQPLTKFAVYTYLNHSGDFHAAAKHLANDGQERHFPALGVLEWSEQPLDDSEDFPDTFSDLAWVLTGERQPPQPPEYLVTDSGNYLFYRGRINGLFGDPETAKSWIAQAAIVQALAQGQTAIYLDIDHNGAPEIAERLLLMGSTPQTISNPARFRIYEPEDRTGLEHFLRAMNRLKPDIVVVDSLGELIPMLGLKSVDNDELTIAIRAVLKPLAHKIGACVITIDHLPKGADARSSGYAIGGIAKKRAIDGSYLSCEAIKPPAPGQIGKIRLTIEKDRHGQVRAHATGKIAGDFILDSTDPTWTNVRIEHPAAAADGKIKPTSAMRAVSLYLSSQDSLTAPSRNSIAQALTETSSFKKHTIDRAIDELAVEHYVVIENQGYGKANAIRLAKPYQDTGGLQDITEALR